jgi:hypothetical protein
VLKIFRKKYMGYNETPKKGIIMRKQNPSVSSITDDDERRAAAQKAINKTVTKFVIYKVGITVAIGVAAHLVLKKLEEKETETR